MTRISLRFLGLALLIPAALLSACSRHDDTVVLKLAHVLDANHAVHKGMAHKAERLDHYSDGTMRIDIYPSGQLGAERDTVELVQIGSLAMTKVSAAPLEAFVPAMQVFSIPYVFRDRDHYFKALDSEIGKELLESVEVARLRGMGYYDSGSRSFYMVDDPVDTPADLDGLKIRVMKSQTAVKMVAALGGSATPISWGELYTALQQGVVDGAENNPPSFYLSGHYEVCSYYALNEHRQLLQHLSRETLGVLESALQALPPDRFQYIADGPCIEGVDRVFIVCGSEHHGGRLLHGIEMMRGFDALHARHADVEQHDVGPQAGGEVQRFVTVGRFADDRVAVFVGQNLAETIAGGFFVVDDQDFHAASSSNGNRSVTV